MIEIFAGSAMLCSVAKHFGLGASFGVDKTKLRAARTNVIQIDLLDEAQFELLCEWMSSPLLAWVHLAPVCGTVSKAREVPAGPWAPKPLRSNEAPEGFSTLTGVDKQRVEAANLLYDRACFLFHLAWRSGILVTLENPSSSYFWITKWWLKTQALCDVYASDFQVCMYGGSRPKWTRFAANFSDIQELDIECDSSHQHAPWGKTFNADGQIVWATSLEAHYPRKLCIAVTMVVLKKLQQLGVKMPAESLQELHHSATTQMARVATHQQPSRKKLPPIVPEFSDFRTVYVEKLADIPCQPLQKISADFCVGQVVIPAHSRFLRFKAIHNKGVSGECLESFEATFGVSWDFTGFLQRAVASGHPARYANHLPSDLKRVVDVHCTWTPGEIAGHRTQWCKKWLQRAVTLQKDEKADWLARDDHVRETTISKRVLLFEEMLQDIGYEDLTVSELLRQGSTLVGEIPRIPIFEDQYKPCMCTVKQLIADSPKRNEAIYRMTKSSGDASVDEATLQETHLEVEKGWAEGPFTLSQLEKGSTVAHRFPLVQGEKIRMIEDYTVCSVNDTTTVHSKVDLHMVDTFCGAVKEFFTNCPAVMMQHGLEAKTYDLKSAYRQVPVRSDHLKHSYFCVYDHKAGGPKIFRLKTLPFGAVHSVYSFLRLAKAIHAIASRALHLFTTNFYDDFIVASPPCLKESASHSMEMIFTLLGWDYAKEGRKATVFDKMCNALGVTFNLEKSHEGVMIVSNTSKRRSELLGDLGLILDRGSLLKAEALRLRGRLQFADSCLHGRIGSIALKRLAEHAYTPNASITDELRQGLVFLKQRLETNHSRTINRDPEMTWFVFSDASYEPEGQSGGIGAVL